MVEAAVEVPTPGRKHWKSTRGQAFVETALVIGLVLVVTLGIIEFGYAFMALNLVTHAATAGARAGAALQVGSRGNCGTIADTSSVTGNSGIVKQEIGGVVTVSNVSLTQTPDPSTCGTAPACSSCTFSGSTIPTVTVKVTGTIPFLFGLLGSSALPFTRTETYRDEGR